MERKDAIAQAKRMVKTKMSGYMKITIGYTTLVLTHKAGIDFLNSLEGAELLEERYQQPVIITGLGKDKISAYPISETTYTAYKLSQLMEVDIDDALTILEGAGND